GYDRIRRIIVCPWIALHDIIYHEGCYFDHCYKARSCTAFLISKQRISLFLRNYGHDKAKLQYVR
ncbi:MAG TPA: hypothetical protein VHO84_03570, partial [Syntrophorhabdaceae bacterium]|nr:hypothetical protein [Syntrophorhabdaceae bacterium]